MPLPTDRALQAVWREVFQQTFIRIVPALLSRADTPINDVSQYTATAVRISEQCADTYIEALGKNFGNAASRIAAPELAPPLEESPTPRDENEPQGGGKEN